MPGFQRFVKGQQTGELPHLQKRKLFLLHSQFHSFTAELVTLTSRIVSSKLCFIYKVQSLANLERVVTSPVSDRRAVFLNSRNFKMCELVGEIRELKSTYLRVAEVEKLCSRELLLETWKGGVASGICIAIQCTHSQQEHMSICSDCPQIGSIPMSKTSFP